ncbi:hypothetical protein Aab01nite_53570 [Paractinoplanes abujensis]|nr:hypothetical protein Aab01nite_53570 [Actinoplanes abujensis]
MTTHDRNQILVTAAQLRVMPLHAVTEVCGTAGLWRRLAVELDQLPLAARATIADAAGSAGVLHAQQRRTREPYVNHVLRVTLRMLCHYGITDPDVLAAGLLHDAVEDQSQAITGITRHGPPPGRADPGGGRCTVHAAGGAAGRRGDHTAATRRRRPDRALRHPPRDRP